MSGEDTPTCRARTADGLTTCKACGFEWLADEPPPVCSPITFDTLRRTAIAEAYQAELSLTRVLAAASAGDPTQARRRAAELHKIAEVFEHICADKEIKAALNRSRA